MLSVPSGTEPGNQLSVTSEKSELKFQLERPAPTDNRNWQLFPFPSIENLRESASNPAGVDGRDSSRNSGCAGRAHQVSDHDPQN